MKNAGPRPYKRALNWAARMLACEDYYLHAKKETLFQTDEYGSLAMVSCFI